jgi:hypothetical protein
MVNLPICGGMKFWRYFFHQTLAKKQKSGVGHMEKKDRGASEGLNKKPPLPSPGPPSLDERWHY